MMEDEVLNRMAMSITGIRFEVGHDAEYHTFWICLGSKFPYLKSGFVLRRTGAE